MSDPRSGKDSTHVQVECPDCGITAKYDAVKGSFTCPKCKVDYRGPSKQQAQGKGPFIGVHHPGR